MTTHVKHYHVFEPQAGSYEYYQVAAATGDLLQVERLESDSLAHLGAKLLPSMEPTLFILPRSDLIEKHLTVPSENDEEITQIANIQAIKMVPYASSEIFTYPHILRKRGDGYTDLLLFIIAKDTLADLLEPLVTAGFIPGHLILRPILTLSFLNQVAPSQTSPINRFAALYDREIELGVMDEGHLLYSRSLKGLYRNPKESLKIRRDLSQSFQYVQGTYSLNLSPECYLIGGEFPDLPEGSIAPEETFHAVPRQSKAWIKALHQLPEKERHVLPVMQNKQSLKASRLWVTRAALFLVMLAALFLVQLKWKHNNYQSQLTVLNLKLKQISQKADAAIALERQYQSALDHLGTSDRILVAIKELAACMPEHVKLTLFHARNAQEFTLRGIARQSVIDFVNNLQKSPHFENVTLKHQQSTGKENSYEFQIECHIKDPETA